MAAFPSLPVPRLAPLRRLRPGPPRSPRRRLLRWLAVAALTGLVLAGLTASPLTTRLDNILYDRLVRASERPVDPSILIVGVDERSLRELGAWPWSRAQHAAMIDRLSQAGAKAIVYDVLFGQPSQDPAADEALATAVARSGKVYLPQFLEPPAQNGAPPTLVMPLPIIAQGAAAVGLVHVRFDPDGVVRRMAPFEANGPELEPDLMTVVHRATKSFDAPDATRGDAPTLLIPFAGPPDRYRQVAFSSVLAGEVPPEMIAGRTVFVGLTAPGLGPAFPTPVTPDAASMTGVQLQASVLDGLRGGRMIKPAGLGARLIFALSLLWLLLAGLLVLPPRANLALLAVLLVAAVGASAALFSRGHLWLSPVAAILGMALVSLVWGWGRLGRVNDLLGHELDRLRSVDPAGAAGADAEFESDVVTRQALSLGAAITRIDDLRRFSADALFSLPDATLVADAERQVIAANAAAQTLLADRPWVLEGGGLADALNALEPLGRTFPASWPAEGDSGHPIDLHLADGRAFQIQTVFRRDAAGESEGWIVRLADITPLTAAMRQREQALQLLTHDMRSPQTSILALLATTPGLPPEASERLAAYARRTLALADGFVQLARAEVTQTTMEPVDLCDVAVEAIDELWPQCRQRHIEIRQEGCDGPMMALGDRGVLARALVNLIGNAVKYGPDGSTIVVRAATVLDGGRTYVDLSITDQGPGLTVEEAALAFRPFQRFDRPGAEAAGGAGLGLAFVQAAATRHGGGVSCRSTPGGGATFTLRLPEMA
ncbi:CHASE2 domain-containing protein [Caulobacter sp. UNC279MFTsu5.1]|uniref:CHASE2 domain-containing protein n=1 Tax=Caulobacter sp. UNC279MFTsu5.1 TaxID=1502775 RepID=UPI0008E6F82F|nr:CHASE2 domain-containing protein [Caulobacter sp. UNC279MFTsu5.1]SFJ01771.1 sensor domain CHASE2-containing protein [Caulobacter sp. UNC279MFTsu5.1]